MSAEVEDDDVTDVSDATPAVPKTKASQEAKGHNSYYCAAREAKPPCLKKKYARTPHQASVAAVYACVPRVR